MVLSFEGNEVPGLDGFLLFFFQNFWHILGSDVVIIAQEFFRSYSLLKELNAIFFVPIPKKPDAYSFQDFRSFSLCNSIYKIFTKILVLRLKKYLPSLISKHQNVFVTGTQILDSIIWCMRTFTPYLSIKTLFFSQIGSIESF